MGLESVATELPLQAMWSPTPAEWTRLVQPTLVIEGDLSWEWIRDIAAKVTELLPNGELATLEGLDHMAPVDAPDIVAQRTVAFIDRVAAAESKDDSRM